MSPQTLAELWLPRAHVLYIAGADPARRRLARMARLGAGELREAPWGGRHMGQLADHDELLVAWHSITWDETPTRYEKRLLARFAELHGGRLPSQPPGRERPEATDHATRAADTGAHERPAAP